MQVGYSKPFDQRVQVLPDLFSFSDTLLMAEDEIFETLLKQGIISEDDVSTLRNLAGYASVPEEIPRPTERKNLEHDIISLFETYVKWLFADFNKEEIVEVTYNAESNVDFPFFVDPVVGAQVKGKLIFSLDRLLSTSRFTDRMFQHLESFSSTNDVRDIASIKIPDYMNLTDYRNWLPIYRLGSRLQPEPKHKKREIFSVSGYHETVRDIRGLDGRWRMRRRTIYSPNVNITLLGGYVSTYLLRHILRKLHDIMHNDMTLVENDVKQYGYFFALDIKRFDTTIPLSLMDRIIDSFPIYDDIKQILKIHLRPSYIIQHGDQYKLLDGRGNYYHITIKNDGSPSNIEISRLIKEGRVPLLSWRINESNTFGLPSGYPFVTLIGKVVGLFYASLLLSYSLSQANYKEKFLELMRSNFYNKDVKIRNNGDDNIILATNPEIIDKVRDNLEKISNMLGTAIQEEKPPKFNGHIITDDKRVRLPLSKYISGIFVPEKGVTSRFRKFWRYGLYAKRLLYSSDVNFQRVYGLINSVFAKYDIPMLSDLEDRSPPANIEVVNIFDALVTDDLSKISFLEIDKTKYKDFFIWVPSEVNKTLHKNIFK